MKKLLPLFIFLITAFGVFAQTPSEYLAKIPALPSDACLMESPQREAYLQALDSLLEKLDADIKQKREKVEKEVENARPEMEKNLQKEYNLSDADISKLKKKDVTDNEKKEVVDKMLKEKGLSMQELEKVKKMSKEEKKIWAQKYAAQQMGTVQNSPEKMEKNKSLAELTLEQKTITDKIHASDMKYFSVMQELDKEDTVQSKILKDLKDPLEKRMRADPGPGLEELNNIRGDIHKYEVNYCSALSPRLSAALGDARADLEKLMPDYKRLEEIIGELNKLTMGTKNSLMSPGLVQMQAISAYGHKLQNVFKYARYSPWSIITQ